MNQAQIERSLQPSNVLALDIIRNHAGINRFQADIHCGHGLLTQRVSDLKDLGFIIHTELKPYIDAQGNERSGVAHYTLMGWAEPAPKTTPHNPPQNNETIDAPTLGVSVNYT